MVAQGDCELNTRVQDVFHSIVDMTAEARERCLRIGEGRKHTTHSFSLRSTFNRRLVRSMPTRYSLRLLQDTANK